MASATAASFPEDSIKGSLNLIHLHQDDYFSQILAKDLLPILEDIKDAHRDDNETSDGGYTMDELEQIADTARNGGNKISSLIAALYSPADKTHSQKRRSRRKTSLWRSH